MDYRLLGLAWAKTEFQLLDIDDLTALDLAS